MKWIITDTKDLEKYSEKILEMYESSYRAIGLIDFGGWIGLKDYLNCSCYLLIDTEHEINGIILYWLSEYGNKISLVISSTPEIGKNYVIPKLIELLQTPGFYIELSDALEYLVRKNGLDNIKDKEIIKMLISKLTDEDIFNDHDERLTTYPLNVKNNTPSQPGSYLREIKDIGIHRKALYGIPCLSKKFNSDKCDRKCISRGGKNKTKRKQNKTKHKKNKTKHKKNL
jgi:hypothetical protein